MVSVFVEKKQRYCTSLYTLQPAVLCIRCQMELWMLIRDLVPLSLQIQMKYETETSRFGFTNGAAGVQEVINSAFWQMVLLHLQRKRSWKNGHSFQLCLLKTRKHSADKLPTDVRSQQFFLSEWILYFSKSGLTLSETLNKNKKEINLNKSPAVPLAFKRKGYYFP